MALPVQASEHRITWKSNTTAQPGLLDKPVPRCTSEQKCADEEQVRHMKEAKKIAKEDVYQRISSMQAQMVVKQSEAQKDCTAMHLKPCLVKRPDARRKENETVILLPCYPGQSGHHQCECNSPWLLAIMTLGYKAGKGPDL